MNTGSPETHRADSARDSVGADSRTVGLASFLHLGWHTFSNVCSSIKATDMPLAEASDVSRTRSARKTKTKPRKKRRFRSLSDPRTLSELALRLKEGIYITTLDGEIVDANPGFLEMFGVESLEPQNNFWGINLSEEAEAKKDMQTLLTILSGRSKSVM